LLLIGATVALGVYLGSRKEPPRTVAETPADKEDADAPLAPNKPYRPAASGDSSESKPQAEDPPKPKTKPKPLAEKPSEPPPLEKEPVKAWLPPEEQKKVDEAIERGVLWLKKSQLPSGSWSPSQNVVGLAALPGLTLLECGVPADDPCVRKAVENVRNGIPKLGKTYELALAILFLDRLGEDEDRDRIRTMALRLIAGQTSCGGWTYDCPVLSPNDERELLTVLEKTRPNSPLDLMTGGSTIEKSKDKPEQPGRVKDNPESRVGPNGGTVPDKGERGGSTLDMEGRRADPRAPTAQQTEKLPAALKNVPALQPPEKLEKFPQNDGSDNSNTQFATLALWAAGRYELPTERALALLDKRFRTSQAPDGHWGYNYSPGGGPGTPAMTGVGLLGLAVGHGLTASADKEDRRPSVADPAIEKGIKALAANIGAPDAPPPPKAPKLPLLPRVRPPAPAHSNINMYFMWTVERVAVLYNVETLDGKNWYGWGSELLVGSQTGDGFWNTGNYHGATHIIDTSLALLFLKRANLARDLSQKLEFIVEIKDRGNKR
jgi:hypothetical protein